RTAVTFRVLQRSFRLLDSIDVAIDVRESTLIVRRHVHLTKGTTCSVRGYDFWMACILEPFQCPDLDLRRLRIIIHRRGECGENTSRVRGPFRPDPVRDLCCRIAPRQESDFEREHLRLLRFIASDGSDLTTPADQVYELRGRHQIQRFTRPARAYRGCRPFSCGNQLNGIIRGKTVRAASAAIAAKHLEGEWPFRNERTA